MPESREMLLSSDGPATTRRIIATFVVVYETDAPEDFDADSAAWQLFDHCPQSFVLEDPIDPLMNDAYDMEAIGWSVETAEWGDMRTGVKP